jgi:hypothetical protein
MEWTDSLSERPTWNGFQGRESARQVIASVLSNADSWDADRTRKLQSELVNVRSVYGIYVRD